MARAIMSRRTILRNQTGASAVEFAIVLALLLILFFGIIEFSIVLFNKAVLNNACREGARTACLYDWPDEVSGSYVETVVKDWCEDHLISFGSSGVNVQFPLGIPEDADRKDPISVRVVYPYHFLVLPSFISSITDLNLTAEHIMRKE